MSVCSYFSKYLAKLFFIKSVYCSFHVIYLPLTSYFCLDFCSKSSGLGGGLFSFFKGLAGQKTLTLDDINPVLDKMKEHLIGKDFLVTAVMMYCFDSKLFMYI